MRKNNKKGNYLIAGIIAIMVGFLIIGGVPTDTNEDYVPDNNSDSNYSEIVSKNEENNDQKEGDKADNIKQESIVTDSKDNKVDSKLKISYIDVGQADSILIQNEGKNMLIDAGNNADGELLVKYLKGLGINKFDVLIGTHPHEDHIGGLDNVIKAFDIGKIYMPKVMTTTATFEDVLDAIDIKNMTITSPSVDTKFEIGDCVCTVISSRIDNDELNNSSIVLRLDFGNTSYLFTGDMEKDVEETILSKDIQVDVLKVGHHGSSTSTTTKFLDKVNPKYAIICVGEGNSYGHPHKEILDRLNKKNIQIYRTDISGTIVVTSDGEEIKVTTVKTNTDGNSKATNTKEQENNKVNEEINNENVSNDSSEVQKQTVTVYVTKTGTKYHLEGCTYLNSSKIQKQLEEVVGKYESCKTCNPPTK